MIDLVGKLCIVLAKDLIQLYNFDNLLLKYSLDNKQSILHIFQL